MSARIPSKRAQSSTSKRGSSVTRDKRARVDDTVASEQPPAAEQPTHDPDAPFDAPPPAPRVPRRTRARDEAERSEAASLADAHYAHIDPFADLTRPTAAQPAAQPVAAQVVATGPRFGAATDSPESDESVRDPRRTLTRPGVAQLIDTETVVRRALVQLAPGATQNERLLADEVARRQYVIRGLSERVPNPDYAALQSRRAGLEAQEQFLRTQMNEYDRLFYNYGMPSLQPDTEAQRVLDEQRMRFLDGFAPPQALSLLKPSTEITRLNREWREHLGRVVDEVAQLYAVPASGGTRHYATQLLAYHVAPLLSRHLASLANSTFDDMPLTMEHVREFFDTYMTEALGRLLEPRPAVLPLPELSDPMDIEGIASSLGHAFTAPDRQEETAQLAYYAAVLATYASREYRRWYLAWRATQVPATAVAPDRQAAVTLAYAQLDSFVERLVRQADRRDAKGNDTDYFHAHRPLNWLEYERRYARLLHAEIAQHRAVNLTQERELREKFDRFVSSLTPDVTFPYDVLLNMPLDVYAALREVAEAAAPPSPAAIAAIEATFDAEARAAQVGNGTMAQATLRHDAAVSAALPTLSADERADYERRLAVLTRYRDAGTELGKVWPADVDRVVHAPLDPRDGSDWSPYDLSYPLDRDATFEQLPDIRRAVAADLALFDADAQHEAAEDRRSAFSTLYANATLTRELSQAAYLLKNVLTETVERPLVVERFVYDSAPLVLSARVELAPELASRIIYVPTDARKLADAEATAALEALSSTRFRIEWLRRSPYAPQGGEEVVGRTVTAPGQTEFSLVLTGAGQGGVSPERVLALAGVYRAVAYALAADGSDSGDRIDSAFVATIRVVARCVRDHATFVPVLGSAGVAQHGECEWVPPPADERYVRELEALRLLVEYGVPEYEEYWERVQLDTAAQVDGDHIEEPPWGSSAPSNLQSVAELSEHKLHQLFSFDRIVGRFVARFAQRVRSLVPDMPTRDLVVLGLVAVRTGTSDRTVDPILPAGNELDVMARSANRVKLFLDAWSPPTLVSTRSAFALDAFNGPLGSVPLGQLLRALALPYVNTWATPREKRYFRKLNADFTAFSDLYRAAVAQREQLPVTRFDEGYGAAFARSFQAKMSAELATMGIDQVVSAVIVQQMRLPRTLFSDDDSENEFRHLVRGLRPYYLLGHERLERQPKQGDLWIGVHSFASTQPSLARVGRRAPISALVTLPRRLVLLTRGSEPQLRGYDYAGLFDVLERAVGEYNRLTLDLTALEPISLQKAYAAAGRAVTVYNYFAHLAVPLERGAFLEADDIYRRLASGFFSNVYFPPTPPTVVPDE